MSKVYIGKSRAILSRMKLASVPLNQKERLKEICNPDSLVISCTMPRKKERTILFKSSVSNSSQTNATCSLIKHGLRIRKVLDMVPREGRISIMRQNQLRRSHTTFKMIDSPKINSSPNTFQRSRTMKKNFRKGHLLKRSNEFKHDCLILD